MFRDYVLNTARQAAGLAIKASSSALAKTVNAVLATINGTVVSVAAGDVALTNTSARNASGAILTTALTVPTGYTVPLTVYATSAGAFVIGKGNVVANATALKSSDFDRGLADVYAVIGSIIVKNATGSDFTGGTTALDTASLTVTYVDNFSSTGF